MNNEELKKKILTIVRGAMLEADELPFVETTEYVADALIAAGIGDVKEAEHRAARAERALGTACEDVKGLVSFLIELSERVDGLRVEGYLPEKSEPKAYINRAEKELAEEGKDD